MSKPDGGPAFPLALPDNGSSYSGVSIRDWMATKFATSLTQPGTVLEVKSVAGKVEETQRPGHPQFAKNVARISYELADAMLEARK